MTKVLSIILVIFSIRGLFGFIQDANFWYKKKFNTENFNKWLDTFERNRG